MRSFFLIAILAAFGFSAQANENSKSHHAGYAGQEKRDIKGLSPDDIQELRRGGGWGLAKAAELNGVPGPSHLLKMKDEVPLRPDQVTKIGEIFDDMQSNAIKHGERLIQLEKNLERQIRHHRISGDDMRKILREIASARMELRYTHLSAHMETARILSEAQIKRYNQLRGYTGL